jgi:pimeloyl-ACP methyl ester carboxylesterase
MNRLRRLALWGLLAVGFVYAGICAFLLIEQNRLLYIGIFLPPHDTAVNFPVFADASGTQLGWVATPTGTVRGTVVYFHGNDEEAWQADQNYAPYFTARGWRVVFAEYRGFDFRAALSPTHDNVIADAVADEKLARQDWPQGEFWVAGNSLGAGIAAQAAFAGGAQRVLLFVPWDRMSAVAQERYPFVPTRFLLWADGTDYDSCAALAGRGADIFITYAGQDDIIPAHHALHLAGCLGLKPAQIIALPTAMHLDWYEHLTATQWDSLLGSAP